LHGLLGIILFFAFFMLVLLPQRKWISMMKWEHIGMFVSAIYLVLRCCKTLMKQLDELNFVKRVHTGLRYIPAYWEVAIFDRYAELNAVRF
jgi:hypothetical protein